MGWCFEFVIQPIMANPQKENGHTPIANELLESLIKANLNGTELALVLLVIRKTYGWGKKEDKISLSQFMKYIPVSKPAICNALKKLLLVKIILLVKKTKSPVSANTYRLNKDFDSWQLVKKSLLVKKMKSTSKDFDNLLVKKTLHTKETITKEILQKKTTNVVTASNNETKVNISTLKEKAKEKEKNSAQKEKESYGNPGINKMLLALKGALGIDAFADSRNERNIGKHLVSLFDKVGKQEFKRRLDYVMGDDFRRKNCNSITYLYNQLKSVPKETVNKNIIF